jgi:hypothetical protein
VGQAVAANLSGRLLASRGRPPPPHAGRRATRRRARRQRQFGISIGVAVTGSIVASTGAGFINSSHAAWAVLGGCGLVALALGIISTSSWAKAAAARNSQRLAIAPIAQHDHIDA